MKNSFFALLISVIAFSACKQNTSKFIIENNLSSPKTGGTLLLITESDSTLAAENFENGHLLLTGNLPKTGFYKIKVQFDDNAKTKFEFPIWLSGDSISIKFKDDLTSYPSIFSPEKNQQGLNTFYESLEKNSAKAFKDLRDAKLAFEEKESFLREEAYNKLLYAIDDAKESVSENYLKAVEQFAKANPSSLVTLKIIADTNPDLLDKNPAVYFAMLKNMSGDLTQSTQYKDLFSLMEKKTKVTIGQTLDFKFFGTDPTGKAASTELIKGKKVILLTFWKSTNRLGRTFKADYQKVYNIYASQGFEIIGICMDDKKDWWLTAIKDDKNTWPQISDLKGIDSPYVPYYNIESLPKNILMNENGKILDVDIPAKSLAFEIKKALKLI